MGWLRRNRAADEANQIIAQENLRPAKGSRLPAIVSVLALSISAYTLWENSLRQANLQVFVPPVVQYASPYQNSNFEVLAIPLTIANEGAQTGTVVSMDLAVTDPKTQATKHFYSADFGRWTMEKTRSGAYQPFAPISLDGRGRRTETVLFYPRSDQEKPDQLVREIGIYRFTLTLDEDRTHDSGWLDRLVERIGWLDRWWHSSAPSVSFERELRWYDARAFTNGTLPMYAVDWNVGTRAARQ
jgi:hypothetical protein